MFLIKQGPCLLNVDFTYQQPKSILYNACKYHIIEPEIALIVVLTQNWPEIGRIKVNLVHITKHKESRSNAL